MTQAVRYGQVGKLHGSSFGEPRLELTILCQYEATNQRQRFADPAGIN